MRTRREVRALPIIGGRRLSPLNCAVRPCTARIGAGRLCCPCDACRRRRVANRRPPRPLWRVRLALALWLIVTPPYVASAELPQEAGVSQSTPIADSQRLDLPSYRDPESPLPGAGVTSQIFTALGTVLGVLALGVYLYKRVVLRGSRGAHPDGTIRILSRTYLGPKESLCLVQVRTDVLLLGQTGSGITLLHTLPSKVSAASSDSGIDEATIGPIDATEHRATSEFAQERGAAVVGLENRLRRLNKLWRTPVPGSDRGEVSD